MTEADRKTSAAGRAKGRSKKPAATSFDPACLRFSEMLAYGLGASGRSWLDAVRTGDDREESGLIERAAARVSERDLRRQQNIEAIFSLAMTMLKDNADADGHVDPDWSVRFIEAASDCGDRAGQEMWAALLALEAEESGAVPPVTFRVMSTLNRAMIRWVAILAKFRINNFLVRLSDEFFGERELTGDCILLLEEYGLLRTNRDLSKVFSSQKEDHFTTNLLYADKVVRVSHEDPAADLTLPCYRLSEAGTALARAAGRLSHVEADLDYLLEIVKLVEAQGYTVAQADILARRSDTIVSKHSPFCELRTLNLRR
ncbi:MAG: DUF2806 domain-containing protein [Nisaea sp.]|jgi:hypothetical protein|uniref:DUF2806 domain-containing protein n=1 Tax=Nisaea sp. TaxID=2024842 RepID=UPI001B2A7AB3|nr:DUF2806 domain-containing protein [Nisaea sp.]MBO6559632.1 DUF2806 domain-containing protein [Nisaea sp.]